MADALKFYLSGPMTGLPKHNYPAFHAAAKMLRAIGHTVYNPAEYPHDGPPETFPIRRAFADYTRYICHEADAICMLPGWQTSHGAQIEFRLAAYFGLIAYRITPDTAHGLLIVPLREAAHG